jgi:MFS family permease
MPTSPPTVDSRTAWIVASAALAILTISYGAPLLAAVALKPIAAELGTSRSAPAAAGSFTYIGAAFGGIIAGWLSGRLGIRRIVLFGATMLAIGLIVSASGGLLHLYIGHGVLMGLFGTSCMLSPLVTYVSRWFERRRGAAVALISSGQSVSGALWPALFQVGISDIGWRRTMMAFGVFAGIAIVLLTTIFLRPAGGVTNIERRKARPENRRQHYRTAAEPRDGVADDRGFLLLRADGHADGACRGVLRRSRVPRAAGRGDVVGAARQRVPVAAILGLAR